MTRARSSRREHTLFAVSAPGLEATTAAELTALGFGRARAQPGGVEFRGTTRALYRANLTLRTATRVLVRVASFRAAHFSELTAGARAIDWRATLPQGRAISLRVTCHKSRLHHTGAVAERLLEVLRALGLDAATDEHEDKDELEASPPQRLVLRLVRDRCTISLDSSGVPLHRRGYRQQVAKAPVRETIAAAMLQISGWQPAAALVDPFCGSGTIAIEAAMIRRGRWPGAARRFAFMDSPQFNRGLWASVCGEPVQTALSPGSGAPIVAGDRDAGAIAAARANAARAGVEDAVSFTRRSLSAWRDATLEPAPSTLPAPASRPGWIISNPPYGRRVAGGRDLRGLYARLGQLARERLGGWGVALLCPAPALARATELPLESGPQVAHGGLRATIWLGAVP